MSQLFTFQGRVSRSKYWLVFLLSIFVTFVVVLFTVLAIPALIFMGTFSPTVSSIVSILLYVLMIPMWIISIATTVKRFHDRDKSGWWVLISLVPIIGALWILIECGFLKGTVGANNFGEDKIGSIGGPSTIGRINTPSAGGISTNKLIISIIVGVILVALVGRAIWAYQQMKAEEARADNIPTVITTTVPELDKVISPVTTAPVVTLTLPVLTTTVKSISSQIKSEIDRYGVDLYKLKQGITTVEKKIDGKSGKVVYTRNKNEIERKVSMSLTSGGKETLTTTIDLDYKEKLLAGIKQMEAEAAAGCKNSSTKECAEGVTVLNSLKTVCLPLQKNEEIGMCIIGAVMGSAMNSQPSDVNM